MPKADRDKIGKAVTKAQENWGKAHLHAGSSIRHLHGNFYECRVDLAKRLVFVFEATPPALHFTFMGDHVAVKNYIKGQK